MIYFHGIERDVCKENKDGELEHDHTTKFDWFNRLYHDVEDLNKTLEEYDFPPLAEWDENPDEPGSYCYTRTENEDALVDNNGKYEVEHFIRVFETSPLSVETR